jgi:ElaB/YqjD/DUF883 family membrane-anchored ribosome-binding protein
VSRTTQFINEQRAKPIRSELTKIEPELRKLLMSSGEQVSPELMNLNKRHSELQRQLESLK